MSELVRGLQRAIEGVYRLDEGLDVADFRVDRDALQDVLQLPEGARETLVVHQDADETFVALFIEDEVMHRAGAFFAGLPRGDTAVHRHLDAVCVATEGVSHFVYFTFCGQAQDRPVSQVELELQAEIDKFLLLRIVWGLGGPALREALFDSFELGPHLTDEARLRYVVANRAARRYARWLDHTLERGEAPRALRDARDLYRMPLARKLEHIERRAA